MNPDYLFLAQTILTEPEHQGIALGAIIVGVIAGILISLGILVPPGIYLWKKFRPAFQEIGNSIRAIAATPAAPDAKQIGDGIREAFAPLANSVNELIAENKTLRQTADDRAAMNAGLNDRITRLEQQALQDKTAFQTQITALQQSLTEKQNELLEKTQTIAEQAVQLQELAKLQKRVADLEQKVDMLTEERAKFVKERDEAVSRAETAEATIRAKDAVITDLSEKLQKAEGDLETLRGQLADEKRQHAFHETHAATEMPAVKPSPDTVADDVARWSAG